MAGCAHHHHHGDIDTGSEKSLIRAIIANMVLTLAQLIGGFLSGSLALIADALHNFSDAAALWIALIALKIGKKPADEAKSFGYKRAETIGALINLTTLVILGLFLVYEAIKRFYAPEPIVGWAVIGVAGIALIVDIYTAFLTYRHSKTSMNMKAAFIHNLTDALASVGVIVSGTLILLYGWVWTDAVITLVIAAYILWHGLDQMRDVIHLLMEGSPAHLDRKDIIGKMEKIQGVKNVHHVHIWQVNENKIALEAHVVLEDISQMDSVKTGLKHLLHDTYGISHSTLEFEKEPCGDAPDIC